MNETRDVGPPARTASPRRRAATRRKLIAAAYEVFSEHSIRDTPVEMICERAGFTRGAFYSNFASKEDLFLAVYEDQMRLRIERLRTAVDDVVHPEDVRDDAALRELIVRVCMMCMEPLVADKNWYLLTGEFRIQALRHPELREHAKVEMDRVRDELGAMLFEELARLGMTIVVSARDAVASLEGLYETAIEQAWFEGIDSVSQIPFITEVLPRMVSAIVVPRDEA